MQRFARVWVWFLLLGLPLTAHAQLKLGDNLEMTSGGLLTVGYNATSGDFVQSSHGIQAGIGGDVSGYYYNPNFLNFTIIPYYNQSHFNSDSQSLSSASGVNAVANIFTGSHFPGSVSYRYDYNSTGIFGLANTPNFTAQGSGQGLGINWSVLVPGWPTLSVGYTHGSGTGNVYGTDQTTNSRNQTFNLRSSYTWADWNLNGFYDHYTQHSDFPLFLAGEEANYNGHGNDVGFSAGRQLPWNGQMYAYYNRSAFTNDYQNGTDAPLSNTSYTTSTESVGATFHPILKLSLSASESYTNNLSGFLLQNLASNGILPPPVNLGASSYSFTVGGGVGYQFTNNLAGSMQATHYQQHYYGQTYTGTYLSGTVNYAKRLWNTFSFSAGIVASYNGIGSNALGFFGNVNASRQLGRWELSGNLSYAINTQSQLITYSNSNYGYSANLHRRFSNRVQWTAAFNGSHSGLSNQAGTSSHSEGYTTSLGYKWVQVNALYATGSGNALLTNGGLVPLPPLPSQPDFNAVAYSSETYGGGVAISPIKRLSIAGTYNRSFSHTLANAIASRNSQELFDLQLRYHFRRIGFNAGATRFSQGISAAGTRPGSVNSYYAGISRWFDFF